MVIFSRLRRSNQTLVIVTHRDIDAIGCLHLLLALLETLVLEVEAVFQQSFLQELGDVVEGDMDEYHAHDAREHIEPCVQTEGKETGVHRIAEEPDGQGNEQHATHQGIEHLLACVKLQVLLVPGADTGDADEQEGGNLAVHHVAVVVNHPLLDAVVQLAHDAAHRRGVDGVLEKLQQYGDVNDGSEYLVKALQFLALFHFYLLTRST